MPNDQLVLNMTTAEEKARFLSEVFDRLRSSIGNDLMGTYQNIMQEMWRSESYTTGEFSSLREERINMQREMALLQARNDFLEDEARGHRQTNSAVQDLNSKLEGQIEELEEQKTSLEGKVAVVADLQTKIEELQKSNASLEKTSKRDKQALVKDIAKLRSEVEEGKRQIFMLNQHVLGFYKINSDMQKLCVGINGIVGNVHSLEYNVDDQKGNDLEGSQKSESSDSMDMEENLEHSLIPPADEDSQLDETLKVNETDSATPPPSNGNSTNSSQSPDTAPASKGNSTNSSQTPVTAPSSNGNSTNSSQTPGTAPSSNGNSTNSSPTPDTGETLAQKRKTENEPRSWTKKVKTADSELSHPQPLVNPKESDDEIEFISHHKPSEVSKKYRGILDDYLRSTAAPRKQWLLGLASDPQDDEMLPNLIPLIELGVKSTLKKCQIKLPRLRLFLNLVKNLLKNPNLNLEIYANCLIEMALKWVTEPNITSHDGWGTHWTFRDDAASLLAELSQRFRSSQRGDIVSNLSVVLRDPEAEATFGSIYGAIVGLGAFGDGVVQYEIFLPIRKIGKLLVESRKKTEAGGSLSKGYGASSFNRIVAVVGKLVGPLIMSSNSRPVGLAEYKKEFKCFGEVLFEYSKTHADQSANNSNGQT